MARNVFYTSEQLEKAKQQLSELPDLSKNKLTQYDMLDKLKSQIVDLATKKGYTAKEIKSALGSCGINIAEKSIKETISANNKKSPKKNNESKNPL